MREAIAINEQLVMSASVHLAYTGSLVRSNMLSCIRSSTNNAIPSAPGSLLVIPHIIKQVIIKILIV